MKSSVEIENYLLHLKCKLKHHQFIHRIPVFNLFKHVSSIAALCNSIFILVNIATDNDNVKFVFSIIIAVFNILILFSSLMYNIFYNEKLTVLQERTIENCSNLIKKINYFLDTHDNFSDEDKEKTVKKIFYAYQDILQSQPPISEKQINKYRKKISKTMYNNLNNTLRNMQNNNVNNINNNLNNNSDISNTSEA
jgi:hypothetical protein